MIRMRSMKLESLKVKIWICPSILGFDVVCRIFSFYISLDKIYWLVGMNGWELGMLWWVSGQFLIILVTWIFLVSIVSYLWWVLRRWEGRTSGWRVAPAKAGLRIEDHRCRWPSTSTISHLRGGDRTCVSADVEGVSQEWGQASDGELVDTQLLA